MGCSSSAPASPTLPEFDCIGGESVRPAAPFHPDPELASATSNEPRAEARADDEGAAGAGCEDNPEAPPRPQPTPIGPTPIGPTPIGPTPFGLAALTPFAVNPFDTPGNFVPGQANEPADDDDAGGDSFFGDAMLPPAAREIAGMPAADEDTANAVAAVLEHELDAVARDRGNSPAITMSECPREMHLRRIEGRGNMARMHGYTADVDQFPAPPHPLTKQQRVKLSRRCSEWLADLSASGPSFCAPPATSTSTTQTRRTPRQGSQSWSPSASRVVFASFDEIGGQLSGAPPRSPGRILGDPAPYR